MTLYAYKRPAPIALCLAVALTGGCGDDGGGGGNGGDGGADASLDGSGADGKAGDGGGSDGSGSDGSGGDGEADAMNCGTSPFDADRLLANVVLVVDKSGSMLSTYSGDDSRWVALTDALDTTLTAVQDDLQFGLDLYPTNNVCAVPDGADLRVTVSGGSSHVTNVIDTMKAVTPEGGTPTAAALRRALTYYTTGSGASLDGDKYVLLATDGGPNCDTSLSCEASSCVKNMEDDCDAFDNCCDPVETEVAIAGGGCLDDAGTAAAVKALADAGIQTVVVGIPGSETFATQLDAYAVAGGITNDDDPEHDYFAVSADGSGAGSLADVLLGVTQELITSCELQLGSDPPDINLINVEVDGEIIPRDAPDGWALDETTDPPTVILQGSTCAAVEGDGAMSVDVTFGCPTVTLI